ncbi:hypothetical protein [Polyangium spumosum]|uniref:Glycosyltransferase RgtA/B/C/D-like domain-containing protein n=1 Tax=Polyangium spumosum TaxID=889282 RepID=A0A6N7Q7W1_9BACT|nr:hypothetical protein [Polyangium spumosum]MRG96951.1 hypothetical protein [Polyangium spumosum]
MTLLEIARAAATAIQQSLPLLAGLILGAALLLLLERFLAGRVSRAVKRVLYAITLLAGVGAGLFFAWKIRWLCDDAFISFRYARNFARGDGLVFNPGEWVEGYTNFLWTLVLGLLAKVRVSIPHAGLFGNLASYVLAIVFVALVVRKASPKPAIFPFAAIALAASRPFHTFASSGLETMPAAMLVAVGMWASLRKNGALWAGLALTAATLTRPDHLLLYGCMGLALVAEDLVHNEERPLWNRLDLRRYFAYGAPLVLIYVPYFFWRWHAYGDFFPNTYYAKSGNLTYWAQGAVYGAHFLFTSGAVLWLPLFLAAILGRPRNRAETRLRFFAILSALVYGQYVMKVGGDFMEHRFFISLLPILAATTEVALRYRLREVSAPARVFFGSAAALAVALAVLPVRVLKPYEKRWNLAEENTFYPLKSVFPLESGSTYAGMGQKLDKLFVARGLKPRLSIDCIGLVGWYADLPIVDLYGLANRRIAHKPIEKRGRPGHEKRGNLEDRLAEGAVVDLGNPWGEKFKENTRANVDGHTFHFIRWDPEVAKVLRATAKSASIPDPARDIRALVRTGPRNELLDSMHFYEVFLERHPDRDKLLGELRARLAEIADFEDDLPKGATVQGSGLRIEQGKRPGATGKSLLASLPDEGDGTGTLEIHLGALARPELRFALGGRSSPGLRVELVVDGQVARTARPRTDKKLTPEAWQIEDLQGKSATLRIVDEDKGRGMGLYIDGIHWSGGRGDDVRARLRANLPGNGVELFRAARMELPESDPDVRTFAARFSVQWRFDEAFPKGTEVTGTAFGKAPAAGPIGNQSDVTGWLGRGFVNGYHGGDASKGKVALPPMTLDGQTIHVLVGGGRDCQKTFVGLEVEGRVVARACGRNDEILRPAELSTSAYVGKMGRVVIVDESTGHWGHVCADDVLVAAAPQAARVN